MRQIVSVLLVINIVGLVVLGGLCFQVLWMDPLSVAGRYTSLDRANVINEAQLSSAFPSLSGNSRYLVPKWLAEPVVSTSKTIVVYALLLLGLNLGCSLELIRRISRQTQRAGHSTCSDEGAISEVACQHSQKIE